MVSLKEATEYVTSLYAREGVLMKQKDDLSNLDWYCYLDDRYVEMSKGLSGSFALVHAPPPDCYQPPHVAVSKELNDQHIRRFPPSWDSVFSWQSLLMQLIYADNRVIGGFDSIGTDLEKQRREGHALQPLSKIESRFKGTVLPMPNYQRSRLYLTFASLILRVIKCI